MTGVAADIKEKHELSKWEMAHVHCSGIFLVRSDRGYHFVASSLTEQTEKLGGMMVAMICVVMICAS